MTRIWNMTNYFRDALNSNCKRINAIPHVFSQENTSSIVGYYTPLQIRKPNTVVIKENEYTQSSKPHDNLIIIYFYPHIQNLTPFIKVLLIKHSECFIRQNLSHFCIIGYIIYAVLVVLYHSVGK